MAFNSESGPDNAHFYYPSCPFPSSLSFRLINRDMFIICWSLKVQLTRKSFFHLTYSPYWPDHLCEKIVAVAFFNFFFMSFEIWKTSRFFDPRPGVKGE